MAAGWLYYYYMEQQGVRRHLPDDWNPHAAGRPLDRPRPNVIDFMKIGDAVMRHGPSTVRLGIAQRGRVQVNIYDVAGRRVRTLADRVFPAGEQTLQWDGTDDAGPGSPRGVYFVRSSNDKGHGRIIVLNR
jgi:hypothetical protein